MHIPANRFGAFLNHPSLMRPGRSLWLFFGLFVMLVALACSSSSESTPFPEAPQVSAIFVTTDYEVGRNRVVFGVVDLAGMPVRSDEAPIRAIFLPESQTSGEVSDSAIAKFIQWPTGQQGIFSTTLNFDAAGVWQLEVDTTTPEGEPVIARSRIQVKQR